MTLLTVLPRLRTNNLKGLGATLTKQHMFVEINPADAGERGIKDGGWVWVTGAENRSRARMKALVTERVGKGVAWMPYHFAGWYEGADLRAKYPEGADPFGLV